MAYKVFFLDRDGVINEEVNYLHEPEKTVLIPGSSQAIRRMNQAGYLVIVITNQAGIAKGYFTEKALHQVHHRLKELLAADGAFIDEIFYCPHHPEFTGTCSCRKPEAGLFKKAEALYDIDWQNSIMVGDRPSDLEAGMRANCGQVFLVKTGYGQKTIDQNYTGNFMIAENLTDVVDQVLGK